MDNRNHKERIRKILALAESPNEHEAFLGWSRSRQSLAKIFVASRSGAIGKENRPIQLVSLALKKM